MIFQHFLLISTVFITVSGSRFSFLSTNKVSSTDNWLHHEIPCVGDNVRLDNTVPVVAFLDHNINAESVVLPDNGILVFSDNGVDLGGTANWQCAKKEQQKDAFFSEDQRHDISFFNPNNWQVDTKHFLHMNQVPSEYDDVVVSTLSSVQIFLDLPVAVNTFQWYKRHRMTTDDFNVLIRSMEGQFQLILTRPWARESDQGRIQRMIAQDPIKVHNQQLKLSREGRVNPNSQNKTLQAICSYIKCKEILPCIQSFIPFGHCCPVCGSKVKLIGMEMNMEEAKKRVERIMEEVVNVEGNVIWSFERKSEEMGHLHSEYEIAIVLNTTNEDFDENFHNFVTQRIVDDLAISLKTRGLRTILDFSIHSSKVDRTIKTLSKVVAGFIYFVILIGLISGYLYRNVEMTVSKQNPLSMAVRYRRENETVSIELDDVGGESVRNSEEVGSSENINPNFECSEEETNGNILESRDGIEMKEIPKRHEETSSASVSASEIFEDVYSEDEDVADPMAINPNFVPVEETCEDVGGVIEDPNLENEDLKNTEETNNIFDL